MLRNFVLETVNAPGTATTVNLAGAPSGRKTFASQFSTGAKSFYVMDDGTQQETGYGTFTSGSPNQFSRDVVTWNSAGTTSRLNFAGSTRIYCDLPAERSLWIDNTGKLIFGDGVDRFAASLTNPGYEKSASGIITQMGNIVVTVSGNVATFNFAIPFPNAAISCVCMNGDPVNNTRIDSAGASFPNAAGMGIYCPNLVSGTFHLNYIAKGW